MLAVAGRDPLAESRALRAKPAWYTLPARIRNTLAKRLGEPDFSHEVKEAMDGCLGCKSCVGQCPIKVDVPTFRAKFLELYYGRYLRPAKDGFLAVLEHTLPLLAQVPALYNTTVSSRFGRSLLRRIGLVETPRLTGINLSRELARRGVRIATPAALNALTDAERANSVVLVQDAFTSYFETGLVLDQVELLSRLGFTPWLAPFRPNGKPLHVHGFLSGFERAARTNAAMLRELSSTGVELIGLDPSMTLTYRAEYRKALGKDQVPQVLLVQEWLAKRLAQRPMPRSGNRYWMLPHCTERTNAAAALEDWRRVFQALGLELDMLPSGCCGMAGTYGHETANRATSGQIYALSWAHHVGNPAYSGRLVATGYSCRCQAKLIDGVALPHPAQALLQSLACTARAPH